MRESISERISERSARLASDWDTDPRWRGIRRGYQARDVIRLRGEITEEHTLARLGAERLWRMLSGPGAVTALGALTGGQAVQQVRAGLPAIYVSGWQVAADQNLAGQTYPDQSLYPVTSVPSLVRRINNALLRAGQIAWSEASDGQQGDGDQGDGQQGDGDQRDSGPANWLAPVVADAEAGFGGVLNAYELALSMIAAGAAGVHFEDQLASEKKCGHLGGKVLVPTGQHIKSLTAARLAADVAGVPTVLIARTDARAATLLSSDRDERDHQFLTGERTEDGFFRIRSGIDSAIARGLAYAPYADLLWMETSTPDLAEARKFAEAVHDRFPGKPLAYNCSPSFRWKANLDDAGIASFGAELARLGYRFQFITLAGFHALNYSMFELARGFAAEGMTGYVRLQEAELAAAAQGYTAVRHQREAGTGYFDLITSAISPAAETLALAGSTETAQFT